MQVLMLLAIRTCLTNIRALLQIFALWSKLYRYGFTSLTGKPASELPLFFLGGNLHQWLNPACESNGFNASCSRSASKRSKHPGLSPGRCRCICFLSGEIQSSQSGWHHRHLWHLKSQPGMILPSTKICGTVWAAKMKMFGVWIKLDSLQTMDPTLDLSCFIMKGSSIHQLENICWDTLEAKLSTDFVQLLHTLSSVIPFRVFMNSSSSERWSASTTWSENETTKREIHGVSHVRDTVSQLTALRSMTPCDCKIMLASVQNGHHDLKGSNIVLAMPRTIWRVGHSVFRFPFLSAPDFANTTTCRNKLGPFHLKDLFLDKKVLEIQVVSSSVAMRQHTMICYDMRLHEISSHELHGSGAQKVSPQTKAAVFSMPTLCFLIVSSISSCVNLRHVLPTLEMLEQNVANSYWCFVSFGENLLLSIHHTNIEANGEDSGKLVLGFGLTMLGAQQNVAPIRDANAAAVEAGRWTILWVRALSTQRPKGPCFTSRMQEFILHWLTQNCSQEERVVSQQHQTWAIVLNLNHQKPFSLG